jgi:hypothetical protein
MESATATAMNLHQKIRLKITSCEMVAELNAIKA